MIKKIVEAELPRCVEILHKCYLPITEKFKITPLNTHKYPAYITNPKLKTSFLSGSLMLGYYVSNIQIAFAQVSQKENGAYELEKLCVIQGHRNKGIATQLLDRIKISIKQIGGKSINATIISEDIEVKDWFLKRGFVINSQSKFTYTPFTDCYIECKL